MTKTERERLVVIVFAVLLVVGNLVMAVINTSAKKKNKEIEVIEVPAK